MDSSSLRINQHNQYHASGKNSANSSYLVWNNFFLAAGIPNTVANEYAVTFAQHRIQINMLKEINKEILLDMGIKAMGDIIAILRHAKDLCIQDELKSGGLKSSVSLDHADLSQHQPPVASINQRTSVTTARLAPSISSLVGSKIASRSDDVVRSTISSQSLAGKRPSNVSYVESKRLRLDQTKQQQLPSPIAEKTLTVRYPSAEAMAKVQQRMFEARAGATTGPKTGNNLPSIKSRLGVGRANPNTQGSSTSQNNNSSFVSPPKRDWQQRRPNQIGNGTEGGGVKYYTPDNNSKYSANRKSNVLSRDDVMRSRTNRLKSTVFNRLGEGPG